jgi:hypothetical protein
MNQLDPKIVQFTAEQLLAAYVQSGSLGEHDVGQALAEARLAIGDYQVRHLKDLVRLSFLLSRSTREFVEHLSENLQMLRASAHREFTAMDGQVRGAINWAQTVPLQVTRPTSFVCADPRRSFDLAENRMLRALIDGHAADLERVTARWVSDVKGWRADLRRVQDHVTRIRANPYYRQIPKPTSAEPFALSARLIERVRGRRSPLAAYILKQFLTYREICGDWPNRLQVYRCLTSALRWPDKDKLFELFTLFALTKLLKTSARATPMLIPIQTQAPGDRWFAHMRGSDVEVRVYYQNAPPDVWITYAMADADPTILEYATTLQNYGARLGSLRPDVVIDCRRGAQRRLLLVEVKNTASSGTVRQGLRELVDYRHLIRSRKGFQMHDVETMGLLTIRAFPGKLGPPQQTPNSDKNAITTAPRILDHLDSSSSSGELARVQSFCWFS